MLASKSSDDWRDWVNARGKSRMDVLSNGRAVLIRYVAQADRAHECALVRQLAPASRHGFLLGQ